MDAIRDRGPIDADRSDGGAPVEAKPDRPPRVVLLVADTAADRVLLRTFYELVRIDPAVRLTQLIDAHRKAFASTEDS